MNTIANRTPLLWALALWVSCWSCSKPSAPVDYVQDSDSSVETAEVTFYIAGMNQKLQIL